MPERNLTDADIDAIIEATKGLGLNNTELEPEEVATLKRFLRVWNKTTGIIGTVVLTTLAVGLVAVFTKGFWTSLAAGVKGVK